jgi:hypothetical protein
MARTRSICRQSLLVAAASILMVVLTGCRASGGGQLAPQSPDFAGPATFGLTVSCEDSGGINPPTGRLNIQLAYADHGRNPIGSAFGIHGIRDSMDPVLESAICGGQNPSPGGDELIFLGRYYFTSSAPSGSPLTCPRRETAITPLCRFEVIVRDNDGDRAPSKGDFVSIALSSSTALSSELDPETVFYKRTGVLRAGNITVR